MYVNFFSFFLSIIEKSGMKVNVNLILHFPSNLNFRVQHSLYSVFRYPELSSLSETWNSNLQDCDLVLLKRKTVNM